MDIDKQHEIQMIKFSITMHLLGINKLVGKGLKDSIFKGGCNCKCKEKCVEGEVGINATI
jgi:hypothetical protein